MARGHGLKSALLSGALCRMVSFTIPKTYPMAKTTKSPLSIGGKITLADVDKMDAKALKSALKDVIRLKGGNIVASGHQNHNSHGDQVGRQVEKVKNVATRTRH